MDTMTEQEFKKLCNDIYAERKDIYQLNPNVSHREAFLWMLLGCLVSLLSVPVEQQPSLDDASSADPYGDAIAKLLQQHASPAFDPKIYLAELSEKLEQEIPTQ